MITTIIHFYKNFCINELNNNDKNVFDSIIILRFGETKVAKENFYVTKKPIKIWDVNVDDMVVSKLIETKSNFKIRLDS